MKLRLKGGLIRAFTVDVFFCHYFCLQLTRGDVALKVVLATTFTRGFSRLNAGR